MVIATPQSARTLLAGAIDYAGLFPPAALSMAEAVAEYHRCRVSADRWALGRFVVPASRLDEFAAAVRTAGFPPAVEPWHLSALVGADADLQLATIERFNAASTGAGAVVDAIECRADTAALVREQAIRFATGFECWIEIPLEADIAALLDAMAGSPAGPKIRLGGVEPAAFPAPDLVIRFLAEVARRGVAFKATAGLHHPVRGAYRLTYAPDSPAGLMYGYLNLLLAAALLQAGSTEADAMAVLLEEEPAAFDLGRDGVTWRGYEVPLPALRRLRDTGLRSFGSCSFREPLSELLEMVPP